MVSKSDNPADPFKKALAEATKVLADNPELSINYSVDPSGVSGDNIRLPQVSRRMTKEEVLLARGTADALAMHHKYHNSDLHSRFAPDGPMAREIYEAMETARCEAIGAKDMPGTTGNINAKIGVEAKRKGFDKLTDRADAPLADAAAYLIRTLTTKKDLPSSANNVLNLWKDFILDQAETTIENLTENLDNQETFAKFSRQIITDLGYGDQLGDEPEAEDDENQEQQDENEEQADDPESSGTDENNDETLDAEDQQSQDEQQDSAQAQMSSEDSSDEDFDEFKIFAATANGINTINKLRKYYGEQTIPTAPVDVDGAPSNDELYELVADPKYKTDPAFRRKVEQQFARAFPGKVDTGEI